jgi:hypothetical protein
MFYHNHRRYKGGKRQGKAPIELLTGETLEADWVELLMQHREKASQEAALKSSPPLELVSHRDAHRDEKAPPCEPPVVYISEPQANSDPIGTLMDAKAA